MKRNIKIKLRSTQTDIIGQSETIEFFSQGMLREEEGKQVITYEEGVITGMKGVESTLIIHKGTVTLKREGSTGTSLFFQQDEKMNQIYYSPYGAMDIITTTHEVRLDITEGPSTVYLRYTIDFKDGDASFLNELALNFE